MLTKKTCFILFFFFVNIFFIPFGMSSAAEKIITDPPPWIVSIKAENNVYYRKGLLDVTLYNNWNGHHVDPKGVHDSTAAIQKAIEDARDYCLVAFLPTGTYKVSDTLSMRNVLNADGNASLVQTTCLLGSSAGAKPTIKLDSSSSGFNDTGSPKPVIWVTAVLSYNPGALPPLGAGDGFNQFVKNVNIDVGSGNSGAIGIRFAASQGSYIEGVKVFSSTDSNYYAGFFEIPSAGMGAMDIEAVGGMYGVHFGSKDEPEGAFPSSILIGATLTNQTERALFLDKSWAPTTIVGCSIIKEQTPAIQFDKHYWSSGATLVLIDSSIEITGTNTEPAVNNHDGRSHYLKNVYFKGSPNLIKSGSNATITGSGEWARIDEYSYCDLNAPGADTHESRNLIDGVTNQDEISSVQNSAGVPPSYLYSQHIHNAPTFEDAGAVNVKDHGVIGDGITDDTAAMQAVINTHDKIYLPKGEYQVTSTITLNKDTKFFGIGAHMTQLIADSSWKPTSEVPLITTVDDADATTYLGYITTVTRRNPLSETWFNHVHWKVGRNSVIKVMHPEYKGWQDEQETNPFSEYKITGNGGGRWYFNPFVNYSQIRAQHPEYRIVRIEGTSEPLTFYGLNPEYAQTSPYVEINNSANVRILGGKTENLHKGVYYDVFKIVNSDNIAILGFGGHILAQSGLKAVNIVNSTNVLVAMLNHFNNTQDAFSIYEENVSDTDRSISHSHLVALYKKGTFDWNVFQNISTGFPKAPIYFQLE